MSHSVFRDLDEDKTSGNGTRGEVAENNLIVFIKKDGAVQVDPNALQDLIVNANTETKSTVSVIRLGSPTPSMETNDGESSIKQSDDDENNKSGADNDDDDNDDDEEDMGSKNSGESNQDSDQDGGSTDKGSKSKKKKKKNKVPGIGLTVEEFYNPEQAIQFATEIMNIAGITNPKQLKADYEHLRYIIQNDHCYTPYTYADSLTEGKSNDLSDGAKNVSKSRLKMTSTPLPSSTTTKKVGRGGGQTSKSTPSNGLDASNSSRFDDANSSNENTGDQNESDEEEAESESDEEDAETENDRDSDLDFSVNDCHSRRAKKIKKRKIQAKKLANKKRRQSTIDFTGSDDNQTPRGKKATKLPKKSLNTSAKSVATAAITPSASPTVSSTTSKSPATTSTSSRLTKVTYVKDIPTSQPTTSHDNLTSKSIAIQKINSTTNTQITPTSSGGNKSQKVIIMRHKVRKDQTENALSGMSSLFTPDVVIKPKSRAENVVATNKTPVVLNKSFATSTPNTKVEFTPNTLKPVVVQSIANTVENMTTPRFITTKLIKSPAITFRKISKPAMNLESEQDKQLDLIDSLLQEKLNKTEPDAAPLSSASQSSIPADIPKIVKMLETSEASAPIGTIDLMQSNSSSSNAMSMTFTTTQSAHDSQMLPDELLDSIANEDFLSDDLLQDVAKLVGDKNLQEVIDQEIQGSSSSTTSISSCAVISQTQIQNVSTMSKPNAMQTTDATPTKVSDEQKPAVNIMKTPTTPSNLSTPTTNKKEIKVKRADGSFITLPPIEAPTTRGAKRRAETTPGSETQQKPKVFTVIVQSDSPMQNQPKGVSNTPTNESIKGIPFGSASKAKPIVARERRASVAVKRASLDSKPRRSLSISNPPPVAVPNDDDDDDEEDGSDGSYNSEDDPNRIWCICRTPHNNRFMICCDKCEEWFHGKCVGITRQMGREMEERQSEWICPNCIKKRQPSIQNIFPRKVVVENSPKTKESPVPNCVVCCFKPSRSNSIYCSDDCIRKHSKAVSNTASSASESDSTTPTIKSPSEKKFPQPKILSHMFRDKMNHVVIYDKATNTFLTGKNAPTQDKLQKWLADHPNHEVLKPGSKKAEEFKERQSDAFKKKQQQLKSLAKTMASEKELFAVTQAAKIQTTLQFESNKMVYVNPTTQKQVTTTSLKRPISAITSSPVNSKSPASRSGEPIAKAPKLSSTPVSTQKSSKRTPDAKPPTHSKSASKSNEQDRLRQGARKSLIEQLLIRTKEIADANAPRLTEGEITEFVTSAELEMFEMFGGDTNMKYKSKYRSLLYNIKDRKNLTLFEKISSKAIEPKQLVRLSTEELASQELAKWRENETKHQLEMITKSELDMLACGNSYVLKTHKGEEVIQESGERSIPVEDLASVLNNSAVSSSDTAIVTKDSRVDKYLSSDVGKSASKSSHKKDGERGHDKKDRHDSRSSGSSSKHKRKRSRERHSSHSSHSHSHKDKSHDKDRKERSSSGGGGGGGGAGGSTDSRKDKKDHKSGSSSSSSSSGRVKHHTDKDRKRDSTNKTNATTPQKQQTDENSIADKILKAQSTINSILHPEEFKKTGETTTTTTNVSSATEESPQFVRQSSVAANESDQEPTSTVTIPSPPEVTSERQSTTPPPIEKPILPIVWSGSISMVDVATFQVSLSPLSGSTAMIEFPKEFDVVGRINPETVWEYLEKIRISKDIVLLKFSPRSKSEDNETAYSQFITYLDARKRLGVIKIPSKLVKDFYIMPLTSHKSLPSILKTTTGFDLGADRPDLLLGIVVRNRTSTQTSHLPIPPKHRQPIPFIGHKSAMTIPAKEAHYTPPSSPNMNIPVQTISKQVIKSTFSSNLDDDEPYSPGGSDDDDLSLNTIPNSYMSSTSGIANPIPDYSKPIGTTSFDKQQLEELNRQIEAEKKEIAMMHLQQTVDIDEPYSPTSSVSPPINQNLSDVVSNISIPANLADILKNVASFGSTTTANQIPLNQYTTSLMDTSDEYVPMAPGTSTISCYAPTPSLQLTQPNVDAAAASQPSKLAMLTDDELMRLVPDEID
ncbi:uncharacterized protein LOC116349151 isoform X2 [Contarinia nasturtii]|uniref:uncharacterized protein LOC116349151 isoform X2 n=1 Tax=Contarinia nasturtii TaxID=265458 RepID=UPI0012D3A59A|nr:uncharacterized protein LOC116349151 isoform X2 [Contarinia nasturtii]